MENVAEVRNVTKSFNGFTLDDISFDIKKGFITGFIGPNGAGKSTTIRCLMGLIRPENGAVEVFGTTHDEQTTYIKQQIGFVYDSDYYYENYTIEKNKRIIAPFYDHWDDDVFYDYLKKFRLPATKPIKQLSKGMQMKFSLAMALAHHPDFIIMDEPTAGLDPVFRRELLDLLQELIQDENKAIFFSTHITTDLERIADFIIFIDEGQILFEGEKEEFTERFRLLKGTAEQQQLTEGLPVIGLRQTDVGFDCLIDTEKISAEQLQPLLLETPSLEDIMYYTVRSRSK